MRKQRTRSAVLAAAGVAALAGCSSAQRPADATATVRTTSSPASSTPTSTPTTHPTRVAAVRRHPATATTAPAATSKATAPPPAGLAVQVHLSTHTVSPGQKILVTYSWSDGDGTLQGFNPIGPSAFRVQRIPPCQERVHIPHPSSGRGSWTFVFDPMVTEGIHVPFTSPQHIQVGVEITTGHCTATETKKVSETVTVLPPAKS